MGYTPRSTRAPNRTGRDAFSRFAAASLLWGQAAARL